MCAARVKGGREEATYEYSCRQGRTRELKDWVVFGYRVCALHTARLPVQWN